MPLSQLFFSAARTEVLETLFRQPGGLGLRQVAVISGLHVHSVELAVNRLKSDRLITRRRAGGRVFLALNREHPAYALLKDVFSAAERDRIRRSLAARPRAGRESLAFTLTALGMLGRARRSIGATG
jgi:hypothetical protein